MAALLIEFLLFLLVGLDHVYIISSKVLPPVQPSEYASMGKIGQYVGHINGVADLKAAMAACSYKNEIILISTTSSFVDAAAQTIGMFKWVDFRHVLLYVLLFDSSTVCLIRMSPSCPGYRRFHIAHVLLISTSEEACKNISSQILGACCAWEEIEIPAPENPLTLGAFSNHRLMHQMR